MTSHQRMEGLLTPHTTMLLLAMVALAGLALYRSLLRPLFKYFYIRRPGSGAQAVRGARSGSQRRNSSPAVRREGHMQCCIPTHSASLLGKSSM